MLEFLKGPSIARRMADAKLRPSGFDYMRLGLAVSVIFFHSLEFSSRTVALPFLVHRPFNMWDMSIVPMFFALSGFLVAGSLDRSRFLLDFVGLRVLRIFPALAADTLFAALALGPALTTLPPGTYLRSAGFRAYLLNMFGDIHYFLPGVFTRNPFQFVNIQLWTIPYELLCYVMLLGAVFAGLYRRKAVFLITLLLVIVLFGSWSSALGIADYRHGLVVPSFLAGIALHLYRDRVPWSGWIFVLSLMAMIAVIAIPHLLRFLPIPLAYATVFLGTLNPKRVWPINTGDYSYGIYLYGFPVMQTLIATLPAARTWYASFAFTMVVTGVLALLSWHFVEKKCLALKPRLFGSSAHPLRRRPRDVSGGLGLGESVGD